MTHDSLTTRFAPSPTGHLHKGHAYSALAAYQLAQRTGGRFILRIEDIDPTRCSPENVAQIYEDLAWLGIEWEEPIRIQSQHLADYAAAADRLLSQQLLYPCFCTRKDILAEIESAGHAPHGSEGPLYPGTCRRLSQAERAARLADGHPHALRLDLASALAELPAPLLWTDTRHGIQTARPELLGDAVIVRKDIGTSYHLAVVLDDALQGVTDIVRGEDLFDATHLHRVLQGLLGLPTPTYHHHPLLTDAAGNRLAKRNRAITLRSLRESGTSAAQLRRELGFGEALDNGAVISDR
ncbi:MAG TPA: tRNA glutamyl-Q(34) synthetase GluQRS [Bacteroidia bacterium]|nr:tRNA glutamyl-Q(34) synthetase GluQRS [Bacteroidia bacterium]